MARFEAHHGLVRNDAQSADLRQIGDELIGHSIGEELLLLIFGEIRERKNGDRVDRCRFRRLREISRGPDDDRERRDGTQKELHPCCESASADEAVAAPSYGLDEARFLRRVAEGDAQLVDGRIEAAVKLYECPRRPESSGQLFARNDVPGGSDQNLEDSKGLFLKRYGNSLL